MKRFYFTFGAGQYFGLLQDSYLVIFAEDEMRARQTMCRSSFGQVWCGCYGEYVWFNEGVREYFKGPCLGAVDQDGNKLNETMQRELLEHA